MTRGERNFEIGDKVFDIRYGWGEVESFEVELGWENEEVPPEIVKELCEFVQYLQDEKVDYISFPEGL